MLALSTADVFQTSSALKEGSEGFVTRGVMLLSIARRTRAAGLHGLRGLPTTLTRAALAGTLCGPLLVGCAGMCGEYDDGRSDPRHGRTGRSVAAFRALSEQARLAPPPKAECEAEAAEAEKKAAQAPAGQDANAELALRIRLEYERECYRQAELRVRKQLQALQSAVREAVKAAGEPEQAQR
jgi:hypothetical protein